MPFFYALLFFLFGTFVIAAPVQGGSRASAPVPTDGTYWFPKTPPVTGILTFKLSLPCLTHATVSITTIHVE
jgi:hypothetical protein